MFSIVSIEISVEIDYSCLEICLERIEVIGHYN